MISDVQSCRTFVKSDVQSCSSSVMISDVQSCSSGHALHLRVITYILLGQVQAACQDAMQSVVPEAIEALAKDQEGSNAEVETPSGKAPTGADCELFRFELLLEVDSQASCAVMRDEPDVLCLTVRAVVDIELRSSLRESHR